MCCCRGCVSFGCVQMSGLSEELRLCVAAGCVMASDVCVGLVLRVVFLGAAWVLEGEWVVCVIIWFCRF